MCNLCVIVKHKLVFKLLKPQNLRHNTDAMTLVSSMTMKALVPQLLPDIYQTAYGVPGLSRFIKTNGIKTKQGLTRLPFHLLQSVYGVPDDGQSQPSPIHISSQPTRKATKEDVQKEVTHGVTVFSIGHYHRSASLIHHKRQSGTRTDELLPYLASSLLPLPLHQITFLNTQLDRHCMKVSKVADSLMSYTEQFMEYDPFVSAIEPSNPWISDDASFWDLEAR